jgi:hypothetical protein
MPTIVPAKRLLAISISAGQHFSFSLLVDCRCRKIAADEAAKKKRVRQECHTRSGVSPMFWL